jgi:hypothetical protein
MKTLLLAAAAVAMLAGPAAADGAGRTVWFTYMPRTQTCMRDAAPNVVIAQGRAVGDPEPTVDETVDDDGKVMAVRIIYPDAFNASMVTVIRMYRKKVDCEAFAASRDIDGGKYQ